MNERLDERILNLGLQDILYCLLLKQEVHITVFTDAFRRYSSTLAIGGVRNLFLCIQLNIEWAYIKTCFQQQL